MLSHPPHRTGWTLRAAGAADAPALADLCAAHAAYERIPYSADGHAHRLAQGLEAGRLFAWLGYWGEQAVGYASATLDYSTLAARSYLHLDCLYLEPEARGCGRGAVLSHDDPDFTGRLPAVHLNGRVSSHRDAVNGKE